MFRHIDRRVVSPLAIVLLLVSIHTFRAADNKGSVEGVVKNASGQAVSGAFVKLKNDARRLTFMVISQAQGRYTADKLPSGKYIVQGVGAGFESKWSAPVDVVAGKAAKADLSLPGTEGPTLPNAWP